MQQKIEVMYVPVSLVERMWRVGGGEKNEMRLEQERRGEVR